MPFDLSNKLVIAVASSALFDLSESDAVFRNEDLAAYRAFQRSNERKVLGHGVAFPLVRRLLSLSSGPPLSDTIEVILLSRNDCDTGLRVFHSIEQHRLRISRAAFVDGRDPWKYCSAFQASLFLSANEKDVRSALDSGAPAGLVLPSTYEDTDEDEELRLAFDFDGVIGDNSGEAVYTSEGIEAFHASQKAQATIPMPAGPLHQFFRHISTLQQKEQNYQREHRSYQPRIRSAIVTARDAPSHERVVTTLRAWGVNADEVFFLGGIPKLPILQELRPHMFFDDQLLHLKMASPIIPCVHIPVDHANKSSELPNPDSEELLTDVRSRRTSVADKEKSRPRRQAVPKPSAK